ncbi:MAG: FtsX-like permease family protein [Candidatus Latescibacteria bacterium]|jgi:putative ABC transport system permease protein|nr:FtsX-like permease family protein [Candidatus Latescibacterota bacterium]
MNQPKTQFSESVKLALDVIWGHKLRSGLVILGVAVAVSTLMGMVAILSGLSSKIEQDVIGGDTVVLQVTKFNFFGGDRASEQIRRRKDLSESDALSLTSIPHTAGVNIHFQTNRPLRHQGRKARIIAILGTTTFFPQINNMGVANGRFFTQFEMEKRRKVLVIGSRPAEELFPGVDPVGKFIRMGNQEYRIIGVFQEDESVFAKVFGSLRENFVVIPYTSYTRDFKSRRETMFIQLIIDGKQHLESVREEVRSLLRARRKVRPGQPDDFYLSTSDAALEFIQRITGPIGLVLVIISSIGLMVGGIGVMVIMLVSVTERTREIGIRKALGATRKEIIWQFLIEATALTSIGGIVGILAGLLLALAITSIGGFPFTLPWHWVLVAVVVSAGIGILFGIFPANRAAKLDPVDALRYEV